MHQEIFVKITHALKVMGHDIALTFYEDGSVLIETLTAHIGLGVPW